MVYENKMQRNDADCDARHSMSSTTAECDACAEEERARFARVDAWLSTCDETSLRATLEAVLDDEEYIVCVARKANALMRRIAAARGDPDDDDDVASELASEIFETCCARAPRGVRFPSAGETQRGRFARCATGSLARPLELRLRLPREDVGETTKAISGMVWHSSLCLGRWLSRRETMDWMRKFREERARDDGGRCLEIGGGLMVAGMTFAAQCGDGWTSIVLTDGDPNAVANARYNVHKQRRYVERFARRNVEVEKLNWNDDEEFYVARGGRSFDVILGADVVHQEDMAGGVVRAIDRYLAPDGIALVVNPAPHSRGGAATFQSLLANGEWNVVKRSITNPIITVGIEDECEDVPLDFYVIRRSENADVAALPPLANLE